MGPKSTNENQPPGQEASMDEAASTKANTNIVETNAAAEVDVITNKNNDATTTTEDNYEDDEAMESKEKPALDRTTYPHMRKASTPILSNKT